MAKKDSPYFGDFISMVDLSCQAAELLHKSIVSFDYAALPETRKTMHKIEHTEDMIKHSLMKRLVKEFVPPIDREDIIQLANELDDVTDKIEDILIRIDIYNVKKIHPAAPLFTNVIERCCKTLQKAMIEFPNFHRSSTIGQAIIDVNNIEEEGDKIYIDSMRDLYKNGDLAEIAVWSKLFDGLEECCDACEHVSDVMEIIIMKNS